MFSVNSWFQYFNQELVVYQEPTNHYITHFTEYADKIINFFWNKRIIPGCPGMPSYWPPWLLTFWNI